MKQKVINFQTWGDFANFMSYGGLEKMLENSRLAFYIKVSDQRHILIFDPL